MNKWEDRIKEIFDGLDFAEWGRDEDEYYKRVKQLLHQYAEELYGSLGNDLIDRSRSDIDAGRFGTLSVTLKDILDALQKLRAKNNELL